ncbi:MAG: ATP-binding protein [Syntrophales bacterium]|nr:ATP-binding protein [Syntrophales bacterium]
MGCYSVTRACPCGYYTDPRKECRCTPQQIRQYQARISGPLLDRIDIHIDVPSITYRDLAAESGGEASTSVRERVNRVRDLQKKRFNNQTTMCNARMSNRQIKEFCQIDEDSERLIEMAVDRLGLSARAYTRILKVARTIADLEEEKNVHSYHISEAIQYRSLDRRMI